jgi:hypothetical protein
MRRVLEAVAGRKAPAGVDRSILGTGRCVHTKTAAAAVRHAKTHVFMDLRCAAAGSSRSAPQLLRRRLKPAWTRIPARAVDRNEVERRHAEQFTDHLSVALAVLEKAVSGLFSAMNFWRARCGCSMATIVSPLSL